MSSMSDKISGKTNQAIGKVTDNDKLKAKGKAQETKGKLKDKLKDAGDTVSKKVDEVAHKN